MQRIKKLRASINRKVNALLAKELKCNSRETYIYALAYPDDDTVSVLASCHNYDAMQKKANDEYEKKPDDIETFYGKDGKTVFLDAFRI